MSLTAIHEILSSLEQESLLPVLSGWNEKELSSLEQELRKVDLDTLKQQQALLKSKKSKDLAINPVQMIPFLEHTPELGALGLSLMKQGKAAAIVVAGGQGTRLGFSGPKGLFPISPVKEKTLFQLIAERTLAASKLVETPQQLLIMTSPQNDVETRTYFKENSFFGLSEDQLDFFCQETLPFLDREGNLFCSSRGHLAQGPDGNGGVFKALFHSKIGEKLLGKGVEYLTFSLVDNPLADPFDPFFLACHQKKGADVTVRCIHKNNPQEKVGVLVEQEGSIAVREYSELPEGAESFPYANISHFCFSVKFAEEAAQKRIPLHAVLKASTYLHDGNEVTSEEPSAWKFERFIFDLLAFSKGTALVLSSRESCFAPLKDKTSIHSVRQAMTAADRKRMEALTDRSYHCEEIARSYYYLDATQSLMIKRTPPKDEAYIPIALNV